MKRTLSVLTAGLLLSAALDACTAHAEQVSPPAEAASESALQAVASSPVPAGLTDIATEAENTAAAQNALTEASARQKALALAGLKEADVSGLYSALKTENGTDCYKVGFSLSASKTEYEYHFRASDGVLLHAEYELECSAPAGNAALREEDAKQRALELTGLNAEDVSFTRCRLENDHSLLTWELHFRSAAAGYQYELELSAVDGALMSSEQDLLLSADVAAASTATVSLNISADAAKKTALHRVPGATADCVRKCSLETEDGRLVYEIELNCSGVEYECVLDASTGQVLEWEGETSHHSTSHHSTSHHSTSHH